MASQDKYTNPNMRRCWDYDFLWTPHHLTADQMEPLRHQMDSLAGDCVEPLNELAAASAAKLEGVQETPLYLTHPRNNLQQESLIC